MPSSIDAVSHIFHSSLCVIIVVLVWTVVNVRVTDSRDCRPNSDMITPDFPQAVCQQADPFVAQTINMIHVRA